MLLQQLVGGGLYWMMVLVISREASCQPWWQLMVKRSY
jgi:hypothetical protein